MRNFKLDILLENLKSKCKYHIEDGGETFCERAWIDTDRIVLRCTQCEGYILKCELNSGTVMRSVA